MRELTALREIEQKLAAVEPRLAAAAALTGEADAPLDLINSLDDGVACVAEARAWCRRLKGIRGQGSGIRDRESRIGAL